MISDETLGLAVARDIITPGQAARLRALANESVTAFAPASDRAARDDEALRLVTGFADIFVTIGIALFFGAIWSIGRGRLGDFNAFLIPTVCAWLLAEFFTRRRRMALPSIVLLVLFVAHGFLTLMLGLPMLVTTFHLPIPPDPDVDPVTWMVSSTNSVAFVLAALGTVGLAVLHYARFRVPITVAAGIAALFATIVGLVTVLAPGLPEWAFRALLLVCGLCAFALGMRFDVSDPARMTRRTDIAFWLHLLAAPLVVHTVMPTFVNGFETPTVTSAIGVLSIVFGLAVIAVLIDRRAILVSGLVYAGVAFGKLIQTFGFHGTDLLFPIVLLLLGVFILLLSAGWHPLRGLLLRLVPAALARWLPHPPSPLSSAIPSS